MQEMKPLGDLIVYKNTRLNENQGFVTPLFKVMDGDTYLPVTREEYPADILVSKDFSKVEDSYEYGELFFLKTHYYDQEKSEEAGSPRYWTKGADAFSNLPINTMLPVISSTLPPKETGTLPTGIVPPRGTFFINDGNNLYGPLTSGELRDGRYIIEPLVHPSLSFGKGYLGVYQISVLATCLVKTTIENHELQYITSLKELAVHRDGSIDYLADDQLIKVVNQQGFGKRSKGLGKKEAERLQQIIVESERSNQIVKSDRLERLKSMLDRYLNEADVGFELVKSYLSSSVGTKFLNDYVEVNQVSLLSDHLEKVKANAKVEEMRIQSDLKEQLAEVENKKLELSKINQSIIDERENAKEEISRIREETKEQARKALEQKQEELSQQVADEQQRLLHIKNEISEKLKNLKLVDRTTDLEKECTYYEVNAQKLKAAYNGYVEGLKDTNILAEKMGEMEAVSRILNGNPASLPAKTETKPIIFATDEPQSAEEVIELMCNHFSEDGGRVFSRDEMTNLIVSVNQSFMTILSGPPGTGKTSTVTRLAEALNLGGLQGDQNFLYIPVGRGWVSSRDILGFYNSLKGVYQESRTGLYEFLNRVSEENEPEATKIILLDEANLSSIEHYWSDFLGMCDVDGQGRPIDTGIPNANDRYLNIGTNTHFVATINNDATTERLSPRLIDRVPVISMGHFPNSFPTNVGGLKLNGAISAFKLKEYFTAEDAELSRTNQAILAQIVEVLNMRDSELGQPIMIGHRKTNAITNYCHIAGDIIGSEIAMDFAISQHILPHIEGYGAHFKKRLQKLSAIVNKSHPRSTEHLERIISGGNEFTGTYSFF